MREWLMLAATSATALTLGASPAAARLERVELVARAPMAEGRRTGPAGVYERIVLRGHFAVDPRLPQNRAITDLALVETDASGLVRFDADIVVLQPLDRSRSNGSAIVEAVNRGDATLPRIFSAPSRPGGPAEVFPLI